MLQNNAISNWRELFLRIMLIGKHSLCTCYDIGKDLYFCQLAWQHINTHKTSIITKSRHFILILISKRFAGAITRTRKKTTKRCIFQETFTQVRCPLTNWCLFLSHALIKFPPRPLLVFAREGHLLKCLYGGTKQRTHNPPAHASRLPTERRVNEHPLQTGPNEAEILTTIWINLIHAKISTPHPYLHKC